MPPPWLGSWAVQLCQGPSLHHLGRTIMPRRVVNCAALNDRGACEANEAATAAVNVPAKLLDALDQHIKARVEWY